VRVIRRGGDELGEVDALITDRYLDSLLAIQPTPDADLLANSPARVGQAVRAISRRLATDLPRFHPSFRFEERLAVRLAEVAATMHLPLAAGAEGDSIAIPRIPMAPQAAAADPLGDAGPQLDDRGDSRPLLIGGAVAASALSLAGAWLAWRRRTSPMSRAVRTAHEIRHLGGGA
jgi:hypothetical protein